MDYDTDEKSMATLRRHLRRAREEYYRYKRYIDHLLLFSYCLKLGRFVDSSRWVSDLHFGKLGGF